MDKKLEVKNLQISFRTQGGILKAVRNISFDLYKGETLAIVGESGSGKSVTSKAIMGILAGNSIVEGGEILYDGQDLLKISEEDFHKLRGDKVAMIFQDPMSSLNPIMRVGQQLTEAMILKAKTGKKNAKNAFNGMLKLLGENMNAANAELGAENTAQVAEMLKKFDTFCTSSTKIEREFNEAYGNVIELDVDVENAILMLRKDKKFDLPAELKRFKKLFSQSYNPFVIVKDAKSEGFETKLSALVSAGKNVNHADAQVKCIFGRTDHDLAVAFKNLARIRKIDSGNHVHKRSLSAAVFTQNRQDLSLIHIQINIFVGHNASKSLGNAAHAESNLFFHGIPSVTQNFLEY